LRTLNSDPDHAILKNLLIVPIGDIFLFALLITSPPVFQTMPLFRHRFNVKVSGCELLRGSA
jgi:hypothetical protein